MSSSDSKWLREKTHKHNCWNIIRENYHQVGNLQPPKYYIQNNAHANTFTHSLICLFKISYTDFVINYISFNYVKHCIAKNICCHDSHVSRGNSRKHEQNNIALNLDFSLSVLLIFLVFHTNFLKVKLFCKYYYFLHYQLYCIVMSTWNRINKLYLTSRNYFLKSNGLYKQPIKSAFSDFPFLVSEF